SASLSRVNLRRYLQPYPHQGSSTSTLGITGHSFQALTHGGGRFDVRNPADTVPLRIPQQFLQAQTDRQNFALDIYRQLLTIAKLPPIPPAGSSPAPPGTLPNPTPDQLTVRRWLAQLAVNIVDFIDEDDISTPFPFYRGLPDDSS